MDAIKEILVSTPLWVYALLAYLIFIGYKSSKSGDVSLVKLSILPIFFTAWSIDSLITEVHLSVISVGGWLVAMLVGTAFGAWRVKFAGVSYNQQDQKVHLEGSWVTMIVVLVIFFSKYYFGYATAVHPELFRQRWFDLLYVGVSGVCTGQFVGVLLYALIVKKRALAK